MSSNEWVAYDGGAAEDCGTVGRGAEMMGCKGGGRGRLGVMWAKLAQLVVYAMDVFWSHWGTSGGCECVCVCGWGLAQIYTFIPSLSLSPCSVNTLSSTISQTHHVLFSVIFRILIHFHVDLIFFQLFSAQLRLRMDVPPDDSTLSLVLF